MNVLKLNTNVKYGKYTCKVNKISKNGIELIRETKDRKYTYPVSLEEAQSLEVVENG